VEKHRQAIVDKGRIQLSGVLRKTSSDRWRYLIYGVATFSLPGAQRLRINDLYLPGIEDADYWALVNGRAFQLQ
jgi:hypothetical protein